MCELFGMSSLRPTDVRFSLEAFSRHGGLEGPHKDGWGIAFYDEEDVRLVKEPRPAFDSACVRFIQEHAFETPLAVSHIRRATQGRLAMKNCQPFARELGGRMHVFAHNGDLDSALLDERMSVGRCRAVGDTDSERAFCALLGTLEALWMAGLPAIERRLDVVERFAAELRTLGPANFLYSDGDALFIHGDRRLHADGRSPHPPGLHVLCRHCREQKGGAVEVPGLSIGLGAEQSVVLAASVPLTGEADWKPLERGELVVARQGRVFLRRPAPLEASACA